MASSNENKSRLQGGGTDSSLLPEALDKHLCLTAQELFEDIVHLASELIDQGEARPGLSVEEQVENRLLLVQELLVYCLFYARNHSFVFGPAHSQAMEQRLLDLFSIYFGRQFFPAQGQEASTEYFKKIFTNEYLAFVRRMEMQRMVSANPDELFKRCIDQLMESTAIGKISETFPHQYLRERISQFLEKKAFFKISRLFLSS